MSPTLSQRLVAATPILTLGVALALFFTGYEMWWGALILGWVVITPLVAIFFGDSGRRSRLSDEVDESFDRRMVRELESDDETPSTREDALDVLRSRYANGDLDEHEFERMVERLLETESIEDAETFFSGDSSAGAVTLERDGRDVQVERE